jgi:hypothetical protein
MDPAAETAVPDPMPMPMQQRKYRQTDSTACTARSIEHYRSSAIDDQEPSTKNDRSGTTDLAPPK